MNKKRGTINKMHSHYLPVIEQKLQQDNLPTAEKLIKSYEKNKPDALFARTIDDGHTLLHMACFHCKPNQFDFVQMLLDTLADKTPSRDKMTSYLNRQTSSNAYGTAQSTALHLVCQLNNAPQAELLIRRGALLNIKNADNKTPLEMVAEDNLTEFLIYLGERGALIGQIVPASIAEQLASIAEHHDILLFDCMIQSDDDMYPVVSEQKYLNMPADKVEIIMQHYESRLEGLQHKEDSMSYYQKLIGVHRSLKDLLQIIIAQDKSMQTAYKELQATYALHIPTLSLPNPEIDKNQLLLLQQDLQELDKIIADLNTVIDKLREPRNFYGNSNFIFALNILAFMPLILLTSAVPMYYAAKDGLEKSPVYDPDKLREELNVGIILIKVGLALSPIILIPIITSMIFSIRFYRSTIRELANIIDHIEHVSSNLKYRQEQSYDASKSLQSPTDTQTILDIEKNINELMPQLRYIPGSFYQALPAPTKLLESMQKLKTDMIRTQTPFSLFGIEKTNEIILIDQENQDDNNENQPLLRK